MFINRHQSLCKIMFSISLGGKGEGHQKITLDYRGKGEKVLGTR